MRDYRFSTLARARGLGTSGQPGAAAVRHAAAAQDRRRREVSVRHERDHGTGRNAGREPRPQVGDVGADERRHRLGHQERPHHAARSTSIRRRRRTCCSTVPVPQPAVVSTQIENIGSVRNRGLEATLDARLYRPGRPLAVVGPRVRDRAQRGDRASATPPVHHHGQRVRAGPVGPVLAAPHPRPAARHLLGPEVPARERQGPAGVRVHVRRAPAARAARRSPRPATTR